MMAKLFKKWPVALVFAILLHLGIFFLFYVNTNENRPPHINLSQKFTENPTINKDYSSESAQAHIKVINTAKIDQNIDEDEEQNLVLRKKSIIETDEEIRHKTLETAHITPSHSINSETISNQNLQEINIGSSEKRMTNVDYENPFNQDLDNIKDNVGLLNTDIPHPESNPLLDRNYNFIKSEIEETNKQLSQAINTIKKSNQQEIDEIQKQNDSVYIRNIENNDSSTN